MAALATTFAVTAATAAAARSKVLVGGLAHIEDLAREMEVFARHVVVEVHLHMVVANLADNTHDGTTVGSLHHQLGTDFHHVHQHIILHEHILVEIHHVGLVTLAVTFFWGQVEGVLVARLLAHQVLLELGQQLVHTEDAHKGILFRGLLQDGTVFIVLTQDVSHGDDSLILNFHNVLVFSD